jgi:hypothetical protein
MNLDPPTITMLVGVTTLGGIVWRMSATSAQLRLTLDSLGREVAELKRVRERVDTLPTLIQRVDTLERFQSRFPREFREQLDREERASMRKSRSGEE